MPQQFHVFISHFAGERTIAEEIQDFLGDAFPSLAVFRSSDANSIETAQGQYESILNALRTADLMIILLSSESSRRPWMPFETGFAMGKQARTFTLLVRGAKPNDLPSPFKEMQLRAIDETEVEKIVSAIELVTGLTRAPAAVNALLRGIREAERLLPNVSLKLEAFMLSNPKGCVSFRLLYEGYVQIALRTITAGIPVEIKDPSWSPREVPGQLAVERRKVDGVDYLFMEYSAGTPPYTHLGGNPLKVLQPFLYPPETSKDLWELRFALKTDMDVFQDRFLLRCRIETDKFQAPDQTIPMSQISR